MCRAVLREHDPRAAFMQSMRSDVGRLRRRSSERPRRRRAGRGSLHTLTLRRLAKTPATQYDDASRTASLERPEPVSPRQIETGRPVGASAWLGAVQLQRTRAAHRSAAAFGGIHRCQTSGLVVPDGGESPRVRHGNWEARFSYRGAGILSASDDGTPSMV